MSILSKLIGSTLDGKYQIDRKLGQGGMGAVYRATHLGTGRPVAVKVISPELMSNNEFIERFKREARAAGLLRHPNVVNVTDFGFANLFNQQLAYLVMEFLDGQSLATLLEKRPKLPLKLVVDIVEQISSAINEAHKQGIIHRDLKPDNIWLAPDRRGGFIVKVLDFGLAKLRATSTITNSLAIPSNSEAATIKLIDGDSQSISAVTAIQPLTLDNEQTIPTASNRSVLETNEAETLVQPSLSNDEVATIALPPTAATKIIEPITELTTVGTILGTPLYMSPEQCLGRELDERSDIYSLGVIVYRMLAGEPPFKGDIQALIKKHNEAPPPSLPEKRPDLPEAVVEIVLSTLAKRPAQRPVSAIALAASLRAASEGLQPLLNRSLALYGENLRLFLRLSFITHLPFIVINLLFFYFVSNIPTASLSANQLLLLKMLVWLFWLLSGCFANVLNNSACSVVVKQLLSTPDHNIEIQSILNRVFICLPSIIKITSYYFVIGLIRPLRVVFPRLPRYSNIVITPILIMLEGLTSVTAAGRAQLLAERLRPIARRLATRDLFVMLLPLITFPIQFLICSLLFDLFQPEGISRETILLLLLLLPVLQIVMVHPSTSIATTLFYFKTKQINGEQLNTELNEEVLFADIQTRRPVAVTYYLIISLLVFLLTVVALQKQMLGFLVSHNYANTTAVLINIGFGANLTAKDERGNEILPLEMAVERGHFSTVKVLLEKSLIDEQNLPEDVKTRILVKAAFQDNIELLKLVLAKFEKRITKNELDNMLYGSVIKGSQPVIKLLIDKGADINTTKPGQGFTPLMASAFQGKVNIVKLLLTEGADVNTRMKSGSTAIAAAIRYGLYNQIGDVTIDNSYEICKLLIEKGAQLESRDSTGDSLILLAARRYFANREKFIDNTEDLIKLLLANGADINDTNPQTGATPLHYAAKGGLPNLVRLILENGAEINRRDNNGTTPIITLLSQQNLDESALKSRFQIAEMMIEHGADVDLIDQNGNSAYKLAVALGRPEWIAIMERMKE